MTATCRVRGCQQPPAPGRLSCQAHLEHQREVWRGRAGKGQSFCTECGRRAHNRRTCPEARAATEGVTVAPAGGGREAAWTGPRHATSNEPRGLSDNHPWRQLHMGNTTGSRGARKPAAQVQQAVRRLIEQEGHGAAATELGFSRQTVAKLAAGLAVQGAIADMAAIRLGGRQ